MQVGDEAEVPSPWWGTTCLPNAPARTPILRTVEMPSRTRHSGCRMSYTSCCSMCRNSCRPVLFSPPAMGNSTRRLSSANWSKAKRGRGSSSHAQRRVCRARAVSTARRKSQRTPGCQPPADCAWLASTMIAMSSPTASRTASTGTNVFLHRFVVQPHLQRPPAACCKPAACCARSSGVGKPHQAGVGHPPGRARRPRACTAAGRRACRSRPIRRCRPRRYPRRADPPRSSQVRRHAAQCRTDPGPPTVAAPRAAGRRCSRARYPPARRRYEPRRTRRRRCEAARYRRVPRRLHDAHLALRLQTNQSHVGNPRVLLFLHQLISTARTVSRAKMGAFSSGNSLTTAPAQPKERTCPTTFYESNGRIKSQF